MRFAGVYLLIYMFGVHACGEPQKSVYEPLTSVWRKSQTDLELGHGMRTERRSIAKP